MSSTEVIPTGVVNINPSESSDYNQEEQEAEKKRKEIDFQVSIYKMLLQTTFKDYPDNFVITKSENDKEITKGDLKYMMKELQRKLKEIETLNDSTLVH